jgi:hypothetical protein
MPARCFDSDAGPPTTKQMILPPDDARDFARQIESLRRQSPALNLLYLQHTGRQHSKKLKTTLKARGLTTGLFAILEDTIITGATDKTEAARLAAHLLPADLLSALVWIKL